MEVIVDRIEGSFLIVEIDAETFVSMPKILAPNAKEGDIINITIDEQKTSNRRLMIEDRMNKLWND